MTFRQNQAIFFVHQYLDLVADRNASVGINSTRMSGHFGFPIQQDFGDLHCRCIATNGRNGSAIRWLAPALRIQYGLIQCHMDGLFRGRFLVGSIAVFNKHALGDFRVAFHQEIPFVGVIEHVRHDAGGKTKNVEQSDAEGTVRAKSRQKKAIIPC